MQAGGAFPGLGVAGVRVRIVNIVIAVTSSAVAPCLVGVPIVPRGTLVTGFTSVSFQAITNHLLCTSQRVVGLAAGLCELSAAVRTTGTHTWFALVLTSKSRVTVVPIFALVTVIADSVVTAVYTHPSFLVAVLCVSVAVACEAVWKLVEARLAPVALPPRQTTVDARTLTGLGVTVLNIGRNGAVNVAVAGFAAVSAQAEGSRDTFVTAATHDIWLAPALPAIFITD